MLTVTVNIKTPKLYRNLDMHNLEGNLSDALGNLTNLAVLKVMIRSAWKYHLPATLSKLVNLSHLKLSLSDYSGSFPEGISNLKNLEYLFLGQDFDSDATVSFYGSIPASFCDLDNLKSIHFSMTALSGLEVCSGKLPNLESLNLFGARNMSLPLQSLLVGRPKLKLLSLDYLPVFGPLELEGQVSLEKFRIVGTSISGTLPISLWNNKNLSELYLNDVNIGGTLPTSIGTMTRLEALVLDFSDVSGTIPPEIGLCMSLQKLSLSGTRIGGTIPTEIGNLSKLTSLSFTSTLIVGTIPNSFKQLVSAEVLNFYECELEGTIPPGVLSLPKLSFFFASGGRLTGTIPDEVSVSCLELNLESNFLEGFLLQPSDTARLFLCHTTIFLAILETFPFIRTYTVCPHLGMASRALFLHSRRYSQPLFVWIWIWISLTITFQGPYLTITERYPSVQSI